MDIRQRIAQFEALGNDTPELQHLPTNLLADANCRTSRNPVVRRLWATVERYNQIHATNALNTKAEQAIAIGTLDLILTLCGVYMTEKRHKTVKANGLPARRQQRYTAFSKLLVAVNAEIERFGGKTLMGLEHFKHDKQPNRRNYWLERLDVNNRAGYIISQYYAEWHQHGITGESFSAYINRVHADANNHDAVDFGGGRTASHVNGYAQNALWNHSVHFGADGLLKDTGDNNFDTSGLRTEQSGNGWGIFVCSLPIPGPGATDECDNYMFSSGHQAGYDHHSSFLGGRAVLAAGEWVVTDGVIEVITAKSGHYKPTSKNMENFVKTIRGIPGDAIIRPDYRDVMPANGGQVKYHTVRDFGVRATNATALDFNHVIDKILPANIFINEPFPGVGFRPLADILPPSPVPAPPAAPPAPP